MSRVGLKPNEHRLPKLDQVSDLVHGTIPLTGLEKEIISTTLFNRLHNVLQNSTFYFTFPACRTSRFIHSLGCMHLAGEMFRSAIVNGSDATREAYFRKIDEEVEAIKKGSFESEFRSLTGEAVDQFEMPADDFVIRVTPSSLVKYPMFETMFQLVRLYGLLHDLAHPPFSHVTEDALTRLYREVHSKSSRTCREGKFYEVMMGYFATTEPEAPSQLHEAIGRELIQEALQVLVQKRGPHANYALLLKHLLSTFIDSKGSTLHAAYSIVDGDLDADRLDFTSRDMLCSGLGQPLSDERLINTFSICQDGDRFLFLPSIRALYGMEAFFATRFDLYRFGVFHHRVRKFDGLLTEAVVSIARKYLADPQDSNLLKKSDNLSALLPADISGLWCILSKQVLRQRSINEVAKYYSQWDDAWLLNILREEYIAHSPESPLKEQLEEILSNKKQYHPLFKRPECFTAIDNAFLECGKADFKRADYWKETIPSTVLEFLSCIHIHLASVAASWDNDKQKVLPAGFLLTALDKVLSTTYTREKPIDIITPAVKQLETFTDLRIKHAFCTSVPVQME